MSLTGTFKRLAIACLLLLALPLAAAEPRATQGVLDLRDWSFSRDGLVDLGGEWEFYWQQLRGPGELAEGEYSYQQVPAFWTRYAGDLPASGYATYRLRVLLPDDQSQLAIYNPGQGTALAIWVNGEPQRGAGQVGTSRDSMRPGKKRDSLYLGETGTELEIVAQISNFHHRKAGFRGVLTLGQATDIHNYQRAAWVGDALILGMLACFGLYFLFLAVTGPGDRATLFFAGMCFITVLRGSLLNQNLLAWFLPDDSWAMLLRVEYLTFYWMLFVYIGFMREIYPDEYPAWLLRSNGIVAGLFSLVMLFSSTLFASQLIPVYQVVHFSYITILLYCLFRVIQRRREYYQYIAFASILTAILNFLDVFHFLGYVPWGNFSHLGFLAFVLVQAVMLSDRAARDRAEAILQRDRAEELEVIATMDPLTQVPNRRHFEQAADRELARCQRHNRPLALILMDIDHFKQVNDQHGHLAGDEVLTAMAGHVQANIRQTDIFARYGGEEFVLVLPETTLEQALKSGVKLGQELAAMTIHTSACDMSITVSQGVVEWRPGLDLATLLQRADSALYQAKAAGRNCVKAWNDDAPQPQQDPDLSLTWR